jgi:CheY-like chemotaxis protein
MQLNLTTPNEPVAAPRARVLVVDDSDLSRRIMAASLTSTYDVVTANDGLEAIERLNETNDFVCIVTDDNMPGCTGVELAEYVRSRSMLSRIPVVVVTAGSATPTARQVEGHRAGAAVFVHKPVPPGNLLNMVNMLARRGQPVRVAP